MKYFFGFALPEEADSQARMISEDLVRTFGIRNVFFKHPPHITLKVPFVGSVSDRELLIEFMQKFTNGRKAIPVELKRFAHFSIGTIFQDVLEDEESLVVLQKELCYGLELIPWITFDTREPAGQPHVTVGTDDIKGRFKFIHDYVHEKYPVGISAILTDIHLFQKPPHTELWESTAVFTLQ